MKLVQIRLRTLFVMTAACAVVLPLAIAASRAYKIANGYRAVVTRPKLDEGFDPRYRIAVLHDIAASRVLAVAIEKLSSESDQSELPSFCSRNLWIRSAGRSPTAVWDLIINGKVVVPETGVQIFAAIDGQTVRKRLMSHKEYVAVAGASQLPKSDHLLWLSLSLQE